MIPTAIPAMAPADKPGSAAGGEIQFQYTLLLVTGSNMPWQPNEWD